MDSQHRHELKTNALAEGITNLPDTFRKHSSKLLTVLAIILLIVAAVRYKRSQDVVRETEIAQSLASGLSALGELQNQVNSPQGFFLFLPKEEQQKIFDAAETDVKAAVEKVVNESNPKGDQARLATAYATLGDLYWILANHSPIATAGPATQPTTRPTNYIDLARDAYQRVIKDFSSQTQTVITARLGLAAVAENKHDWKAARDEYRAIIESTSALAADKLMAERRIARIDQFEKPLLLLPASQPVRDEPTTLPAGAGLTEFPSLDMTVPVPATQPTPTTAPATQP